MPKREIWNVLTQSSRHFFAETEEEIIVSVSSIKLGGEAVIVVGRPGAESVQKAIGVGGVIVFEPEKGERFEVRLLSLSPLSEGHRIRVDCL